MSYNKIHFVKINKVVKTCFLLLSLTISNTSTYAQVLKIGDPAPSIDPYQWIKGEPITSFENGTAYVVEMGATWCKPCAAAIPELTELAKKYKEEVKIIGIFVKETNTHQPEYLDKIRRYVAKQGDRMEYHVAADGPDKKIEKAWIKAMKKSGGVPQTFVIDKSGSIAGHFVGANLQSAEELLISILDGSYTLAEQVAQEERLNATILSYDRDKPLFVDGNGGDGSDFAFRSILTKARESLSGYPDLVIQSYWWVTTQRWKDIFVDTTGEAYQKLLSFRGRYQTVNTTLAELYQAAYGDTLHYREPMFRWSAVTGDYPDTAAYPKFKSAYGTQWREALVEVSDQADFDTQQKWNYALNVPQEKATAGYLQQCMREDLERYFGYEASVETRQMPCWFLKADLGVAKKLSTISPTTKYSSDRIDSETESFFVYSNGDIRDFIFLLHNLNPDDDYPIIDKTGIPGGRIDYKLPTNSLQYYHENDFEGYKQMLEEELGLYLEKGEKPMKVVVIKDRKH